MSATTTRPVYYETSDFGRTFGVTSATVDKWCRLGLLSPLRTVGGRRLFTEADREAIQRLRAQRAANMRHGGDVAA